jgi:quercetin dioxygenase-like cupin family protein
MRALRIAWAAVLLVAIGGSAHGQVTPEALVWSPISPAYAPGALSAVVHGDPSKDGISVVRLKMPPGYRVALHTHSTDEFATVLSGEVTLDLDGTAHALKAGAFVHVPAGVPHGVSSAAGTELEIVAPGPRTIVYVNPADDPRRPK